MKKHEHNILIGSLLGDGWLNPLTKKGRSTFQLKYNDKSLGYLKWIRNELRDLKPQPIKRVKRYSQHCFRISGRNDLGELRKIFYPKEGPKIIPANIGQLITDPITLAIWYQDDGTLDRRKKYHWNAMFATYCFSYKDCQRLANAIRTNFGIEVSVCKCQMRGKMYYRLYVLSKNMKLFVETIKPYVHRDFSYKLAL